MCPLMIATEITIQPYESGSVDIDALTQMIHRAYARLADAGFAYVAASQSPELTKLRCEIASCWIARDEEAVVGTIAYNPGTPRTTPYPPWYGREDVAFFSQFAVAPEYQGRGIGDALLQLAQMQALADGKREIACDTAAEATTLVGYYLERGFRVVDEHTWPRANYTSVVLSKTL